MTNKTLQGFASELRQEFCRYAVTNDKVIGINILNMLVQFDEAYDQSMVYFADGKAIFPSKGEVEQIKNGRQGFAKIRMAKRTGLAPTASSLEDIVTDIRVKFGLLEFPSKA